MKRLCSPCLVSISLVLSACAAQTADPDDVGAMGPKVRADEAYDLQSGLVWRRCPVGMDHDGTDCTGVAAELSQADAAEACDDIDRDYRLPTLAEVALLLGNCSNETEASRCQPCRASAACSSTLSAEEISDWTWTSDPNTDAAAFVVEISDGRIAYERIDSAEVQVRCVRPAL